jgi:hypothetical protein
MRRKKKEKRRADLTTVLVNEQQETHEACSLLWAQHVQIMAYPKTAVTPIKIVSMMPNSRILHIKISFSKLETISQKSVLPFLAALCIAILEWHLWMPRVLQPQKK